MKTVIVTGAGRGIGRGIALAFAKSGYQVVVADLNQTEAEQVANEIVATQGKALAVKCDVSDKGEVDNLINKTMAEFGQVHCLVNNAGIYPYKSFIEMTEADWNKVMDVNLKSVFLCSQAVANVMQVGAKIVNISSIASVVGFENLTHYCASKGAINAYSRALALEVASKGINVNVVAPGAIATPGAAMSDEQAKQTMVMIPKGRIGQPEDIAQAALFLASDQADYITGQVLVVDGGWTLR